MRRFSVTKVSDAIQFLSETAKAIKQERGGERVILIGDARLHTSLIKQKMVQMGLQPELYTLETMHALKDEDASKISSIICCFHESRLSLQVATFVLSCPNLAGVPFEHATLGNTEFKGMDTALGLPVIHYISPLYSDPVNVMDIYRDSLEYFEPKCKVKDYLDTCQVLKNIVDCGVEGAVGEFGSFCGHNGWLMAHYLKALGSDRDVYLFDMFEQFPNEELGIDHLWNQTHMVDFEMVQERFRHMDNVHLVKGDFTKTFESSGIEKFAMVFIDCDSYRGTEYLVNRLYEDVLADGGYMIFEDYGHAPLLGTRVAFHNYFDGRTDCLKFYSHFSGMYIVNKISR